MLHWLWILWHDAAGEQDKHVLQLKKELDRSDRTVQNMGDVADELKRGAAAIRMKAEAVIETEEGDEVSEDG